MSGGPVQLMVFGYQPGDGVEERIMAELDALEGKGLLRLLDFLFVHKTLDGNLEMLDVGDDEDYGTILAGFFDWEGEDVDADVEPDELAELAESLEAGASMAVVLVEHLWAAGLFDAVGESGGELLSEGFITEEGAVILGAEVEAISDAAQAIEAAHEAAAIARLEALQAIGEAAVAVEAAEEIRTAAAAEAISALIAAGILEQRAADEAADSLVEAGLIISDAEEAEDEALAEAAEAITESEAVKVDAGLAEVAAIEEAESTEELAARREAAATITRAEKRLLRYLGTGLSFAMIAEKMHVSRGAVKDRAGKLYKKLGVHNREDAVEVAAELGVLDA